MPKLVKARLIAAILILSVSFIFLSCEKGTEIVGGTNDDTPLEEQNTVTLTGQVINGLTQTPIDSAAILIVGLESDVMLIADEQGRFDTTVYTDLNANLAFFTYKTGFFLDTTYVFAAVNRVTNTVIRLYPVSSTGGIPSGDPVSIFLASQSAPSIGVRASGSEETARIIFVVQDSAGIPIDLDHSVDVTFSFGAAPHGGEILSPATVKTNANGEAIVNLTSGTAAGTVQIIATINIGSRVIRSLPVGIAIHGGLPDDNHFSIASQYLNFPGYNVYGLRNSVSAYVGDKYGNPVKPETAVYFTTTGGIIVGSTLTDDQGIGSVDLISADPKPLHPTLGAGFATITAITADETSANITDEIVVLFSGIADVSVSPTSFDMANGGSQLFTYYVGDQNGNPLAGGTSVSVTSKGADMNSDGEVSFSLPDTQSPGWTQFSFIIYDTKPDTSILVPASVTVTASGPNGKASQTVYGQKR